MKFKLDFSHLSCAIYQQTKNGKAKCGDNYFLLEKENCLIVAIADGLGSGDEAYEASIKATEILQLHNGQSPEKLIALSNSALLHTRGVVISIAKIDYTKETLTYCGIGNIQFALYPQGNKRIRPMTKPGYLDGKPVKVREWVFTFTKGDKFVMYSDGIDFQHDIEPIVRVSLDPCDSLEEIISRLAVIDDDATLIIGG